MSKLNEHLGVIVTELAKKEVYVKLFGVFSRSNDAVELMFECPLVVSFLQNGKRAAASKRTAQVK